MNSLASINHAAVLAAAIASFLFGGAYYAMLSKAWMRAVGKSPEQIRSTGMFLPMVITAVSLIVMAIILSGIIHHVAPGAGRTNGGLLSGFLCWLGFVATTQATNHAYQGQKLSLTMIDAGYWLGVFLFQGAILGTMGV